MNKVSDMGTRTVRRLKGREESTLPSGAQASRGGQLETGRVALIKRYCVCAPVVTSELARTR